VEVHLVCLKLSSNQSEKAKTESTLAFPPHNSNQAKTKDTSNNMTMTAMTHGTFSSSLPLLLASSECSPHSFNCEFLEKKLVGFVQVASPSRLVSSEGRVEERVRL
jgi:hypothetical protein